MRLLGPDSGRRFVKVEPWWQGAASITVCSVTRREQGIC